MTTDDRRPDDAGEDKDNGNDAKRRNRSADDSAREDAPDAASTGDEARDEAHDEAGDEAERTGEGEAGATGDADAEPEPEPEPAAAGSDSSGRGGRRRRTQGESTRRRKRGPGSEWHRRKMEAEAEEGGEGEEDDSTSGFLTHLVELRDRVMRMVLGIVVIFAILFPFRETFYTYLAEPLMAHLPEGTSMIAIEVASPFLIPFKLTLFMAIFLAAPWILYQIWAFVAPGLYVNERRIIRPLIASSILLFYAGIAFAYYIVFPLVFAFFTAVAPAGVEVMTDISRYLSFVITIFFAFGIAFQVPVATILLVIAGVTTPEALAKKRPYFIVAAFVVGMVLTPPDAISQTLLALPMWLLFEIGIWMAKLIRKRTAEATSE